MTVGEIVPLDAAIRAEISGELEVAKAKYGEHHFELLCIEGSSNDAIVDDRKILQWLRSLNRTGSMYIAVACEM